MIVLKYLFKILGMIHAFYCNSNFWQDLSFCCKTFNTIYCVLFDINLCNLLRTVGMVDLMLCTAQKYMDIVTVHLMTEKVHFLTLDGLRENVVLGSNTHSAVPGVLKEIAKLSKTATLKFINYTLLITPIAITLTII